MSELLTIASSFAAALDRADWDAAQQLLAPGCRYDCRGDTTEGAGAIISAYREVDEWVKRTFERVRYNSQVAALEDGRYRITFRDLIDHRSRHLDFRCQQLLSLDAAGKITRIEHFDLPGERERADAFNEACGVMRPGQS